MVAARLASETLSKVAYPTNLCPMTDMTSPCRLIPAISHAWVSRPPSPALSSPSTRITIGSDTSCMPASRAAASSLLPCSGATYRSPIPDLSADRWL